MTKSTKQRERYPVVGTPEYREAFANAVGVSSKGLKMSGSQIQNFRAGWAMPILQTRSKVHYFERSEKNIGEARSLCGRTAEVRWLYGPGNHDYCRTCKAKYKYRRQP